MFAKLQKIPNVLYNKYFNLSNSKYTDIQFVSLYTYWNFKIILNYLHFMNIEKNEIQGIDRMQMSNVWLNSLITIRFGAYDSAVKCS